MADHRDFAQRLKQACDSNSTIPELGRGRQVHIAKKMDVSQEAVRRWLEGESKPRPQLMKKLAEMLRVDEAWLSIGSEPTLGRREKRIYSSQVEASAYIVFGLFMANGHSCAFAQDEDDTVDFYAIKAGQQKMVSVTTGMMIEEGVYDLPVKRSYQNTINIVAIPISKTRFEILVLDIEGVDEYAEKQDAFIHVVAIKEGDKYVSMDHEWKILEDSGLL